MTTVSQAGWVDGMKKLTPLGHKVLVKLAAREEVRGGIIIPQSAKVEASMECVVVAVGKPVVECREGDVVLVSRHAGTDVLIDKVPHALVPADRVLAVLTRKA